MKNWELHNDKRLDPAYAVRKRGNSGGYKWFVYRATRIAYIVCMTLISPVYSPKPIDPYFCESGPAQAPTAKILPRAR